MGSIDLAVEGFASLRFGCTMALAMLGLAPVIAAQRRALAGAVSFWLMAGLSGWARFAGLWFSPPGNALLVALGVGVAAAVAVAVYSGRSLLAAGAAGYCGLIAGWLWVPCVGPHLSEVLNDAATDRAGTIVPILVYVLGVSTPLFVLAAAPLVWRRAERIRDADASRWVALVVGATLAVTIAAGWYNEFVRQFTG